MAEWLGFYATVTRTPLDGWALVRERGWIGRPDTVRETGFETETAAIEASAKVRQRKERRVSGGEEQLRSVKISRLRKPEQG